MPAAGVVTIALIVLIVLALVYYLLSTILELRKINQGLDEVIASVGEIVQKSAPVNDVVDDINANLDAIYRPELRYRLTGVVLSHLRGEGDTQLDLFGEALRAERVRRIYDGIDRLDAKYGKHTVFLGSSFPAMQGQQHTGDRGGTPAPATYVAGWRE